MVERDGNLQEMKSKPIEAWWKRGAWPVIIVAAVFMALWLIAFQNHEPSAREKAIKACVDRIPYLSEEDLQAAAVRNCVAKGNLAE